MEEWIMIEGQVDAVYFQNPTTLYKVIRVRVDTDQTQVPTEPLLVMTGQFPSLHLETAYQFFGQFTHHPKYGDQFAVNHYQQVTLTSENGLIQYLSSHRFPGIGKVLAERIVAKLGQEAIDRILSDKTCLKGIQGLKAKTIDSLFDNLQEHQGVEWIYIKLAQWGFGPKLSEKMYQTWGSQTIEVITENPYILLGAIEGIGFNKTDTLAEQLDFDVFVSERLQAALYAVVADHCLNEGHTYMDRPAALQAARDLLESSRPALISEELLQAGLEESLHLERLLSYQEGLILPSLYYAERNIAALLKNLNQYAEVESFSEEDLDAALDKVKTQTGVDYDASQIAALKLAIQSPYAIITGGPGTGKTTLIKGLITLHSLLHCKEDSPKKEKGAEDILLAAPTGRAAKRMSETTGLPAMTLHRLLGLTMDADLDDLADNTLDGTLLIVDEMSMVDTWLMNALLKAIPYHMQVILVGDADQLPSVGPGQVFFDLIDSQHIPTISLSTIYRQAQSSTIIKLAHAVKQGFLPTDFMDKQADRSFIPTHTHHIIQAVQQIVAKAHDKGFDATTLQVLAPKYKGIAGIDALNTMLQALLNPPGHKKREILHFDKVFRTGDKVIQLVNNTEAGVFNGDIGTIVAIYTEKETQSSSQEVIVNFDDDRELTYTRGDLDQITLAYCTSIHKAQGSEYPLVILPLVDRYSRLLRKDLLYTAVTRAQQALVMVGDPQSFYKAVTHRQIRRRTHLQAFMAEFFADKAVSPAATAATAETPVKVAAVESLPKGEGDSPTKEGARGTQDALMVTTRDAAVTTLAESQEAIQARADKQKNLAVNAFNYHGETGTLLTLANYLTIPPMIGMDGITPYQFLPSLSQKST